MNDYNVTENLHYTMEHKWALLEQGLVRMGITDYAQKELHEIVFVDAQRRARWSSRRDP